MRLQYFVELICSLYEHVIGGRIAIHEWPDVLWSLMLWP